MPAGAPPRRRRQAASAPGTPSIWRAARCSQWTLPPPSTGGRRSSTGYGCSTTCPGVPGFAYRPACGDAFQIESIFYNTYQQEAQRLGRCAFLPNHLRNAARDWTHGAPEYDCLVLTVSPMDKHGCFSLAGSACIELEVLPRARRVVVEVASCAPRIFGDVTLHVSQVDAIVESDRYPAALSPQPPDEVDRQLGRVVAELVEDGATIQLGFGGTITPWPPSSRTSGAWYSHRGHVRRGHGAAPVRRGGQQPQEPPPGQDGDVLYHGQPCPL